MPSTSSFLKDQLAKPSEDSKKWQATILGLKGVAGIFVISATLIFFRADLAPHIATLAQFTVSAWGGIIALYLGAQGSVDFKTTAALETVQKNETLSEKSDLNVTVTGKYDPAIEKKYADKYATDESYRPTATVPDMDAEDFR